MKKGGTMRNILLDWYKPTKRGEKARVILAASGQVGAVGKKVKGK